jgi:hypothetical protein
MKKITLLSIVFTMILSFQVNSQVSEDFETDPPSGWTFMQTEGDDPGFVQTSLQAHAGTYSFYKNDDNIAAESTAWMISPVFAASTGDVLSFWYYQNHSASFNIYTGVWISTASADPIANPGDFIELFEFASTSEDMWTEFTQSLDAYNGQNVYVAFKYTGDWADELYIDDFLMQTPPTDTPDWYNIQWVTDGVNGSNTSLTLDAWTPVTAYAQVLETGFTEPAGQAAGIECWIGGNDTDTDPSTWPADLWEVAVYNGDVGSNDEYKFDTVLDFSGTVYVAARWRLNGGPYVYGGYNGPWNGTTNNNIELIVNPLVVNDNCDAAIALTVNADLVCGTVTAGTTVDATESFQDDDVTGTPNNDVWYSFVATGTAHTIEIQNVVNQGGGTSTSTDMGMGVYDATGTCAGLVFFDDSDPNTLNLTGLTATTTYYVRVYGWSSSIQNNNFDICVGTPPPPPANDDCANATVVSALPFNNSDGGTSATNNAGFVSCDGSSVMNDGVWFTFTTINGGTVDIAITGVTGWDPEVRLFSGSCGTFTCVANADSGGTGGSETISGATVAAGTQYWINVAYWSGFTDNSEGPFTIDISTSDTTTLPVSEYVFENFKYFPNPVNDVLNLRAQSNIQNVSIYNMLGQEVSRISPNTVSSDVDMSALQTGVYFVNVTINDTTETIRIIKQ